MSILSKLLGGAAPFDLLLSHLRKVMECVDLTKPLVTAATMGNAEEVRRIADRVFKLEHEADGIKNELRDHLPKAVLLPVARVDLLNYLREQDGLADKVEDLAAMLCMRDLRLPNEWNDGSFQQELITLVEHATMAAGQAAQMLLQFDELRKKGFSGNIIEHLRQEVGEVGYREWKADKQQYKLVQRVLSLDSPAWPFASSYVLLSVIRSIGKMADRAESMADYLRLMIAD